MTDTLERMRAAVEQLNNSKEGDDVKDAINKIGAKDLQPIFQLDEDGNRLFNIVVDYLNERGLIESVDVITITMLAKSLAIYIAVARHVHGYGDAIQIYPNGTSNVSGAFTALSKAQDQVLKLSAKLGLSPMDRSRILGSAASASSANNKSQEGDEIDNLI
jgi:P27 family predicted phage terminase small subunit